MSPIEARSIIDEIRYPDLSFRVDASPQELDFYLQVRGPRRCQNTGQVELQHGRKWRLSKHMTRSEVVQTALKAVLAFQEHEARKNFLYRGRAIFGPHFNVEKLWELAGDPSATEERDG